MRAGREGSTPPPRSAPQPGPTSRVGSSAAAHLSTIRGVAAFFLRSRATRVAGAVVGVAVLAHSIDAPRALVGVRDADLHWVLPAFLLTALSLLAGAVAWGVLVRCDRRISWRVLGVWYAGGVFAAEIVPAGVGGDAVRGVHVSRAASTSSALASVAASRLVAAFAIALWGLAGAVLMRSSLGPAALGVATLFAGAIVVGGVLALNAERLAVGLGRGGRLRVGLARRLSPFATILSGYGRRPGVVGQVVLAGLAGWALQLGALTIFARSLAIDVGWPVFAVAMPLTLLATWLPVAANGVGVKEGVLVGLLAHSGVDTAHAATLTFLIDLQMVPFAAVGALVWLSCRRTASCIPEPCPTPVKVGVTGSRECPS